MFVLLYVILYYEYDAILSTCIYYVHFILDTIISYYVYITHYVILL